MIMKKMLFVLAVGLLFSCQFSKKESETELVEVSCEDVRITKEQWEVAQKYQSFNKVAFSK